MTTSWLLQGRLETLASVRSSHGAIVVESLEETQQFLEKTNAVITQPITKGPTGESSQARFQDGNPLEYVQWKPEHINKLIK